ncbi:peptidoglycan-binding protein, partial [Listeria monocytogenes]|nr:peptidoglycan-binding protein [Listeria monocytogenes]
TTSTDNGASPNYTNKGQLTGDNFIKQEIEVATPTSGGGGGGEGTTGSVELTKTDDSSQKNPLEGAEFKLVNGAGATVQTGLKTNVDGKLAISNLKYDTYQLIETKAPQGYVLDASPVKFTIDDTHQSLFVSKENTAIKGSVSLEKVDRDTKSLLADAEFELQDKDGNTLKTNLKTDQKGKLTVADLLPGEYQFVETKAPTGYILDTTPLKFKISTEALNVTVTKENTKKPEIPKVPVPPKKPEKPDKIISEDSKQTALPKTGDSPLVNGWGLLLVAISASGLIALRRK